MSYQNQSFGMMDEGYFVPRGQLLNWLNDLLKLNLIKIQQLGSGAVYCQLMDVIHPGKVALSKVNWKAKNDYEYINNLKLLQNAFDKIGIKKHVEVEKLAKAKHQDNLEFTQWLKRYFDLNCGERASNYDAQERRGHVATDFSFAQKSVAPKTFSGSGVVKPVGSIPQKPGPKKTTTSSTTTTTSMQKKEQIPITKVKSPSDGKRVPQIQKQQIVKIKRQTETETEQQIDSRPVRIERVIQKQIVIQYETDPKLQAQLDKAFADLEQAKVQSKQHEKRSKQFEIKLEMIKQIMKSEDDSDTKVLMIEEILKQ